MKNRHILFTAPYTVSVTEEEFSPVLTGDQVLVRTEYTAISAGTERDNLKNEPNLYSLTLEADPPYPRHYGYSGSATVLKTGPDCKRVKPGDRVVVHFGTHSKYAVWPESKLFPILYDDLPMDEAALLVIASFPAEGVRKTRLEFGESAMVMGLGILGLMAVQMCRAAGAVPVIAVDPNPERRALSLSIGADYALDPTTEDFFAKVDSLTRGQGVQVCVDAAGNATATTQALHCLGRFGRITLLGCTRHHGEYDLYHLVHGKGVQILGANTWARPEFESRPGCWTAEDDVIALQKLMHGDRFNLRPLISEIHSPLDAIPVYDRLVKGDFPVGVLFDWNAVED